MEPTPAGATGGTPVEVAPGAAHRRDRSTGGAARERPAVTTPLVPELPQLPDFSDRSSTEPGAARPGRAFEPAATGALLLLLALTVVLAVVVRAVPLGPLLTVVLLLLVSVGALALGARGGGALPVEPPEDLADGTPETQGVYYYDRHGRPVPIDDAF
jgi:hypothetical protein